MKKTILFTLIFACFNCISISAQNELTEKESQLFELVKTIKHFSNNSNPYYFDINEYAFERSEDGIIKIVPKRHAKELSDVLAGDNTLYYEVNTEQNTVNLYNDCKSIGVIRVTEWENEKPLRVSSSGLGLNVDGIISYNEDSLVECFDNGLATTRKNKKKVWIRTYYCLAYDGENRVTSMVKKIQHHKGKKREKLKETKIFNDWEMGIVYNEENIEMNITRYKNDGKKSTTIDVKHYTIYEKEGVNKWDAVTKSGKDFDKTYIENTSYSYDQGGNLTRKKMVKDIYTDIWEYEYDEKNKVTKMTKSSKSPNNPDKQEITAYTYNSYGLVENETLNKFTTGTLDEKRESMYSYLPEKENGTLSACSYKRSGEGKIFNGKGVLIQEMKDNKMRYIKNGSWTNWTFFKM